jgi:hypothetical protein
LPVEDGHPDNIGGQEIAGKLNPFERTVE